MSNYYRIADDEERERLLSDYGRKGGVYKLHCFDADGTKQIPVHRVLGTDENGVLYIGKTPATQARIHDLYKSLSPKYRSSNHHGGRRFAENERFSSTFPVEQLCVSFAPADDPGQAEGKELESYSERFGELPPLNAVQTSS